MVSGATNYTAEPGARRFRWLQLAALAGLAYVGFKLLLAGTGTPEP